jgi:hypothetical protein
MRLRRAVAHRWNGRLDELADPAPIEDRLKREI